MLMDILKRQKQKLDIHNKKKTNEGEKHGARNLYH